MRYDRAARPCALNFRLAALKCCFGQPPNALSSVGVWFSMPPLCASFIQNVITLTGHLFIRKKCGVSKHGHLSINLKLIRCPSLSCPLDSLPGGQAVPGYPTPRPGYLNPRGASCPGRFILPPAHIKKILLCDVYYYLQHYNNYMQFLSYNYVNLDDYFKHSVGFLIDKGWGASCPGRFILPPT